MNRIPYQIEQMVKRELEPGERIEWEEMPTPHFFSPASIGAFLFAIPWTAFAVFWMFLEKNDATVRVTS